MILILVSSPLLMQVIASFQTNLSEIALYKKINLA